MGKIPEPVIVYTCASADAQRLTCHTDIPCSTVGKLSPCPFAKKPIYRIRTLGLHQDACKDLALSICDAGNMVFIEPEALCRGEGVIGNSGTYWLVLHFEVVQVLTDYLNWSFPFLYYLPI